MLNGFLDAYMSEYEESRKNVSTAHIYHQEIIFPTTISSNLTIEEISKKPLFLSGELNSTTQSYASKITFFNGISTLRGIDFNLDMILQHQKSQISEAPSNANIHSIAIYVITNPYTNKTTS